MYSTIPTHETEEQALLAVRSKQPKRGGAVGVIVAAFILGVACVSVARSCCWYWETTHALALRKNRTL